MSLPACTWDCFLLNLSLERCGVVANLRLRMMYNALVLMALVFCGVVTWSTKGFLSKLPVKVSPDIHYRALYQNSTQQPLCLTQRGWLNESVMKFEKEWKVFREPCYYSCGFQEPEVFRQKGMGDCLSPERLAIIHSYQDVFLRTSLIKYYNQNASQHDLYFIEKFYPFAEDMGFDFSYTYYVDAEPSWFFGMNPKRKSTDAFSVSGTSKEATTLLLDASGAIYKILDKQPRIHINMREVITLAQRTALTLRGNQHLPIEVLRSGISISVEVKCFNDAVDMKYLKTFPGYHLLAKKVNPTTTQPACVMSFMKVSDFAYRDYGEFVVDTPGFNVSGKDPIFEQLGGIQVKAHDCYSIMRFPEIAHIMLEVASLIVLLSLPNKAMKLVMQHMLGGLSAAYKSVFREPINLSEIVILWAVRTVAHVALFANLLGSSDTKGRSRDPCQILDPATTETMSASSFQVLLQQAFADVEDTDPKKVGNLAHFTIQSMMVEKEEERTPVWGVASIKLPPVTTSTHISALHFLATCRSDADIPFYVMMNLLDTERSLGLVERFFFPAPLWEAMSAATASNQNFSEELARAIQNDDSSSTGELQKEVAADQTEGEELLTQLSSAVKSAMQDIKNLRSDLDLAREEMRTASQDLNHTRLELECAKQELEKASRNEPEMPKVPPKTIKPASPALPEIISMGSLPQDWLKQIEQISCEMEKRLAHVEKQFASTSSNSLGNHIPDASDADKRRSQTHSSSSDDTSQSQSQQQRQSQSQYSSEYTDLRKAVDNIELSLGGRINEVLFRCVSLEHSMQSLTNDLCATVT